MTIDERIRASLARRKSPILLRRDVEHLGSPSQVGAALAGLVEEHVLVRLIQGVYAKAERDPAASADDQMRMLGVALFARVGAQATFGATALQTSLKNPRRSQRLTRLPVPRTGVLHAFGTSLPYEIVGTTAQRKRQGTSLGRRSPATLGPTGRRILAMARKAGVRYAPTRADAFANVVTQLAGDCGQSDPVRDTIQALKRAGVIDMAQLIVLTKNYMEETLRVQPV